jgi:polygalacturonase
MSLTKVHNRMAAGAVANVLDFGAVGDGSADDTAAIQAAIDSLPNQTSNQGTVGEGGQVFFLLAYTVSPHRSTSVPMTAALN